MYHTKCCFFRYIEFKLWSVLTIDKHTQVFTREELQMVADLCIKYDAICLSDEVYEWMVYDDNKHIKIGDFLCHLIKYAHNSLSCCYTCM